MVGEKRPGPDPGKLAKEIQDRVAAKLNTDADQPAKDPLLKMEDAVRAKAPEPAAPDKKAATELPPEPISEKLTRLKQDLEEKRLAYAQRDVDISGKWARLKRTLGFNIAEVKDAGVEAAEKDYYDSLWKYIEAEKKNMPAGEGGKELARALLKQIWLGEVNTIKSLKEDKTIEKKKEIGEWPEKCIDGYKKAVDWWKGLSLKKKLTYSGVIFGLGVTGAGASFAAVGASMLAAKLTTRFLGAGAMYAGAKKWQEARFNKKLENEINQSIEVLMNELNWEERIAKLDKTEVESSVKQKKSEVESRNLKHKRRAFYLAAALPAIGTAVDIYRWGFGGGGAKNIIGESQKPSMAGADGTKPLNSDLTADSKYGIGPEATDKPPVPAEVVQGIDSTPKVVGGAIPVPEIDSAPKSVELGSDTIRGGGSLWRSTEKLIRANPEKYGLDPTSKTFVRDARRMTKDLLDRYAEKQGVSYDDLDKMARRKVRAGDILKIFKNPVTGEPEIQYPRGDNVFNPNNIPKAPVASVVEQGTVPKIAGAEEVASEEMKVKSGPAEYPTQKSVSQIKSMEEIEADYKKDLADRKYARAVRAEKDLAILQERQAGHLENVSWEAHQRQVLATRGLLNRVVEGAGVGNNVSFWEGSALEWHDQIVNKEDYIMDDVQRADLVNKLNLNLGKMRELFLKLGKPEIGQSMGDYLHKAMENSSNIELINQIISRE